MIGELATLVAEEPLRERERLHALRMLALYRSGRQADALAAYRQARTALVERIGVEPGPELRSLQEAILHQDPGLAAPAASELPPGLAAATPLVGRDAELERLREQWRLARAGGGRLVLIAGVHGSGKTRLASELALEVQRDLGDACTPPAPGRRRRRARCSPPRARRAARRCSYSTTSTGRPARSSRRSATGWTTCRCCCSPRRRMRTS